MKAEQLRIGAEAAQRHEFDLLGSGPVCLGPEIDWHADFKSGYRWPDRFYQDVEVTRQDDASDAKVPWDLSRGHHLLVLGRAAALFRDEGFAAELETQLSSWVAANRPGHGINWTNAMEVGLRATAWAWAVSALVSWRPLNENVSAAVVRSLQSHGRHIAANLEGTPYLRSNHYLSDILGLLVLGSVLEGDRAAPRWFRVSHRAFEREIHRQVYRDGVGFEASLSYHGLALEIFLIARWIAAERGRPFSGEFDDRLRKMLEVSRVTRHPTGRIPPFGDSDDGRVLPASTWRQPSHEHLLWWGSALLGSPRPDDGEPSEEVGWNFGLDAWRRCQGAPPAPGPRCAAFTHGGLYVLDGGGAHAVVRCGDVGQNGNGGHGHNDLLSYELSFGVPLVIDSGTYVYTSDPTARNAFRSTRAHNTIVVEGQEINPIEPRELFRLRQVARPDVRRWEVTDDHACLVARHDGYRRLPQRVVHERTLRLDRRTGTLVVTDRLDGAGPIHASCFVHLAAGTEVLAQDERAFELVRDVARVIVEFSGAVVRVDVEEAWVSDRYGVHERAPLLVAVIDAELPATLHHGFAPTTDI